MNSRWLRILLVFMGCLASVAWRKSFESLKLPPLASPPVVRQEGQGDRLVVELQNVSREEIFFTGRAAEAPQIFLEAKEDGVWRDAGFDWCGTGMSEFSIKPGESVRLEKALGVFDPPVRIYSFFRSKDGKRVSLVLLCTRE